MPERFAFCLNTLLSDIASLNEEAAAEIVSHQINLLLTLASTIETSLAASSPCDQRSMCNAFPRSYFILMINSRFFSKNDFHDSMHSFDFANLVELTLSSPFCSQTRKSL